MDEIRYCLLIFSSKTDQIILEAHGITLVCAYNLIKLYGNHPKLFIEKDGEMIVVDNVRTN